MQVGLVRCVTSERSPTGTAPPVGRPDRLAPVRDNAWQIFLAVFAAIVLAWFVIKLVEYGADELCLAGGIDRPFESVAGELTSCADDEPEPQYQVPGD
jgi:hypothetical protein